MKRRRVIFPDREARKDAAGAGRRLSTHANMEIIKSRESDLAILQFMHIRGPAIYKTLISLVLHTHTHALWIMFSVKKKKINAAVCLDISISKPRNQGMIFVLI